jgi:hypothetical protein
MRPETKHTNSEADEPEISRTGVEPSEEEGLISCRRSRHVRWPETKTICLRGETWPRALWGGATAEGPLLNAGRLVVTEMATRSGVVPTVGKDQHASHTEPWAACESPPRSPVCCRILLSLIAASSARIEHLRHACRGFAGLRGVSEQAKGRDAGMGRSEEATRC